MSPRSIIELESVASPAWPEIAEAARVAGAHVIPVDPDQGRRVLYRLQMTAGSYLGALALNCGGLLADHGWFRLYGGGSATLPDLASASGFAEVPGQSAPPGCLVIGTDALGGQFAIDGGALGMDPGEVCYYGPDALAWGGLGCGHAAFVRAVLDGSIAPAFETLRWPGWENEVARLDADQGLSLYPPPFTAEGKDLSRVSRKPVPMSELQVFYAEAAAQL